MNTLAALFMTMSVHYHLPPGLLSTICFVESKYDVNAVHYNDGVGNSVGVCQIKLSTARHMGFRGTEQQLMSPRNNIKYAAKYLRYQLNRYKSIERAVIAYNVGNARGLTTSKYQRTIFKKWRNNDEISNR